MNNLSSLSSQSLLRDPHFSPIPSLSCPKKILLALAVISTIGAIIMLLAGSWHANFFNYQFILISGGSTLIGISCTTIAALIINKFFTSRQAQNPSPGNRQDTNESLPLEADLNSRFNDDFSRCDIEEPQPTSQERIFPHSESITEDTFYLNPENSHLLSSSQLALPQIGNYERSALIPIQTIRAQTYFYHDGCIQVKVNREHMRQDPQYHLDRFHTLISFLPSTKMEVLFLKINGEQEERSNSESLINSYINFLFSSCLKSKIFCYLSKKSGFHYPKVIEPIDKENLNKLGIIIGYCSRHNYKIGSQFDSRLFRAILNGFNSQNLNSNYDELNKACKTDVLNVFYDHETFGSNSIDGLEREEAHLWDIIKNDSNELEIADFQLILKYVVKELIHINNCEDFSDSVIEIKFNKSNRWKEFKNIICQFCFSQHSETLVDSTQSLLSKNEPVLTEEQLRLLLTEFRDLLDILKQELFQIVFEPYLKALHSLAKGFKSSFNYLDDSDEMWETIRMKFANTEAYPDETYLSFQLSIQGCFDRTIIANNIKSNSRSEAIILKTNWLKNWIENIASLKEIRDFLIYCTGSSSLLKPIEVIPQYAKFDCEERDKNGYSPIPIPNASLNLIELAPIASSLTNVPSKDPSGDLITIDDRTEDNFIHCIKIAISKEEL